MISIFTVSFIFTADGLMDIIVSNFLEANALNMAQLQQINSTAETIIGKTFLCCIGKNIPKL